VVASLPTRGDVVTSTATDPRVQAIDALVASVPDPEIPILTLADLGILRGVDADDDGHVVITITPTYSGCPAIDPIRAEVERVLAAAGYDGVELRTALAPAWTTDWISDDAREKLRRYGIAPPEPARPHAACRLLARAPRCPRCGSQDTREVSPFGSTPCQSQHVCNACLEPFDRFKTLR
jgi:ring-1,2-phenylacetyl-CoA epoxidase subunit PaaD